MIRIFFPLIVGWFLGVSSFANTKADSCSTFTVAEGTVELTSEMGKNPNWKKVSANEKACAGDWIRTSKDSRAQLTTTDQNMIFISENTEFKIETYKIEPSLRQAQLELLRGKLRNSLKAKYNRKDDYFHVKTQAAVAGVRGTDFLVDYNPSENFSNVVTFEGFVDVSSLNLKGEVGKPVRVEPGFSIQVKQDQKDLKPLKLPPAQLQKLNLDSRPLRMKAVQENPNPRKEFEKPHENSSSPHQQNQHKLKGDKGIDPSKHKGPPRAPPKGTILPHPKKRPPPPND